MFFLIRVDSSRSELIRVDPTRTGGPSWSGPTFVPAFCDKMFWFVQYRSNVSWQSRLETRFLILEVFENRVSRLEFWVSIFEVREPSFEDRVSSFETLEEFFEDLEQTIDARLYLFFRVVHFLQDTRGSLIYTEADESKLAQHQNAFTTFPAKTSDFFLRDYNPERVCDCFHLHDFNHPLKT